MKSIPDRGGFHFAFARTLCLLLLLTVVRASAGDITLPQANGGTLTLPGPAVRVITLAPNLAELLYAAGGGHTLLATVEYSHFPPEVRSLPRVGNAFRIDLERIVSLRPDLVIAWQSGNPQTALQKLQSLGLNVLQIEISQPEDIAVTVEILSRATGSGETGLHTAAQLRKKLTTLRENNLDKPVVDYFYQVAARPLYTVSGEHIISRGLALCGGRNAFADLATLAPQVSREAVLTADPRVLIAPHDGGADRALENWLEWPRMQAVAQMQLLYLPADEISQATPRFLDSIGQACDYFDDVRQSTGQKVK
jgi:iron complex transport system substrate-binding protein